ncbi:MAG: esterase, partial [Telluria sp.]
SVRFSSPHAGAPLRSYTQSTSVQLRDPGPQHVSYAESAQLPTLRSGSLAFDALFALAGAEMQQNSVAQIKDGNYNDGKPIACDCFETGEKWHYVWTRDLSYAADLGLAILDPQRVMNSLDFKLSPLRHGIQKAPRVAGSDDGLQIIQDTGSGGSWPVSTDRVSWAFGADQVLKTLPAQQRKVFAARAFKALTNTLENDRLAAFDAGTGLYTGEQSFLDWREQSYASWIVNDLAALASSKALSTNVAHYKALTLTASLAREHGFAAPAEKYSAWASDLKKAINQRLWLDDANMYSSLTAPHFDGAPLHKFDWLGQALAIVTGVADEARARRILASYPHGPMGAPVIYPQQQGVPVYHNRAIWPFVTAYGLKAAAMSGNVSVADAAYDTLVRAAALNLSNMENLEWLSGQALLLDEKNPDLIGPVINSKRQLWSVGAYLGMVIENVFGVTATADGIAVKPFITSRLRREALGATSVIKLNGLQLHGKRLSVSVRLPKATPANGYYAVRSIALDGAIVGPAIAWDRLAANSKIEITLGALQAGDQQIRRVNANPYGQTQNVFAPPDPATPALVGKTTLTFAPGGKGIVHNIFKDGQLAASGVAGGQWTDHKASAHACYAVEAQFIGSGNRSHHSPSACTGEAVESTGIFDIAKAGNYQVQLRYSNTANQINLGISGAVKWMTIRDHAGRTVAEGVVQMPHSRREAGLVYSTPLGAALPTGTVTVTLEDFYNMSYLQANSTFSAAGGAGGALNRVDIHAVRILRVK